MPTRSYTSLFIPALREREAALLCHGLGQLIPAHDRAHLPRVKLREHGGAPLRTPRGTCLRDHHLDHWVRLLTRGRLFVNAPRHPFRVAGAAQTALAHGIVSVCDDAELKQLLLHLDGEELLVTVPEEPVEVLFQLG